MKNKDTKKDKVTNRDKMKKKKKTNKTKTTGFGRIKRRGGTQFCRSSKFLFSQTFAKAFILFKQVKITMLQTKTQIKK